MSQNELQLHPQENTNLADQEQSFQAVKHAMLGGREGGGEYLGVFVYLYQNRFNRAPDGPLSPVTMERDFRRRSAGSLSNLVHKVRKTSTYHSVALPADLCPCHILIERSFYRMVFLHRGAPLDSRLLGLRDLAAMERLGEKGHLVEGADVMIYIHQGDGIDGSLTAQMIENMKHGVTYKYFIPQEHLTYLPSLFAEILAGRDSDIGELMDLFRDRLLINIVSEEFPFMFSIHNSNKYNDAKIFLRTLHGARLLEYAAGATARTRIKWIKSLWPERPRSPKDPIVAPCMNVATVTESAWKELRILTKKDLRRVMLSDENIEKVMSVLYP